MSTVLEATLADAKASYLADTESNFDHQRMLITWNSLSNPQLWYTAEAEYGEDHSIIPQWGTLSGDQK